MKKIDEKVHAAIANLRNHNHNLAANKLEKALEKGSIDLIPASHYTDHLIYAALIFAGIDVQIELDPVYTFKIKEAPKT